MKITDKSNAVRKLAATYTYLDQRGVGVLYKLKFEFYSRETGEFLRKDYRTISRPDPLTVPNMVEWKIGKYRDMLYRLPQLNVALSCGEDVYWCEGEKDADNGAEAYGITTTSHYQGGAGANREQAERFEGFTGQIRLVMDYDSQGYTAAYSTAKALREAGVPGDRIVFLRPRVKKLKADLTNHIESGYGLGDLIRVKPDQVEKIYKKYKAAPPSARHGSYACTEEELETIGTLKPSFGTSGTRSIEEELVSSGVSRARAARLSNLLRGSR